MEIEQLKHVGTKKVLIDLSCVAVINDSKIETNE